MERKNVAEQIAMAFGLLDAVGIDNKSIPFFFFSNILIGTFVSSTPLDWFELVFVCV